MALASAGGGARSVAGCEAPHNMDYNPTRWPESPRIVMRCAAPSIKMAVITSDFAGCGSGFMVGRQSSLSPWHQPRNPPYQSLVPVAGVCVSVGMVRWGSCMHRENDAIVTWNPTQ